jgi:hypothetical protein
VGYFIFYTVVISPHDARYAGQVFLLLVACVWLALAPPGGRAVDDDTGAAMDGDDRASRGDIRHLVGIFAVVLAAQVAAMLMISPSATIHRFASNRAIARAATSAHLGTTLVSGADFDATSIGGYLDHPVYSVARHAWIRFFTHDALEASRYDRVTSDEIVAAARRVVAARGRAAGVIVTRALPEGLPGVRQIATAGTVLLYRVDHAT